MLKMEKAESKTTISDSMGDARTIKEETTVTVNRDMEVVNNVEEDTIKNVMHWLLQLLQRSLSSFDKEHERSC